MCQQTRVTAVIPFYQHWMGIFPDWLRLARASPARVLRMWEGLGYYRRARFLHALAKTVSRLPEKELPADPSALRRLPGIGDYTAGAIASIAFGKSVPAFDGNVARVLGRLAAQNGQVPGRDALRSLAGRIVPRRNPGLHNQALMELGALVCLPKSPRCHSCPLSQVCPSRKKLPSISRLKLAPVLQKEIIWVAGRDSRIWLTQNHPLGRWQGLHLLPTLPYRPHAHGKIVIRYPFTRYLIHAVVLVSENPPPGIPGRWMTLAELRRVTLPAPHRKILRELGIG